MRKLLIVSILTLSVTPQTPPAWEIQSSGVTARLRGVSAVSETVVWASGTAGTVIRTLDG